MSIEVRYFKKDDVVNVKTSLHKLVSLSGSSLAKLAKQNMIHNHALKLHDKPRFDVRNGKNDHPEGRTSIYCRKMYSHGTEHGKFKCTLPVEFMRLGVEVHLDTNALTNDSLKHLAGARNQFYIPLDEFFYWSGYETMSALLEEEVDARSVSFPVKRTNALQKELERTLIKELVQEAQERIIKGAKGESIAQILPYVKAFNLVFNID